MNQPKINNYEVIIGPKTKVAKDNKSKARVINFPFDFPNESKGVIIICRLEDEEWIPVEDIKSIVINFK